MGFINFLKRLGRSKIQHSSEGNTTEKVPNNVRIYESSGIQ